MKMEICCSAMRRALQSDKMNIGGMVTGSLYDPDAPRSCPFCGAHIEVTHKDNYIENETRFKDLKDVVVAVNKEVAGGKKRKTRKSS